MEHFPHDNVCYSSGVALNAVANAKLQDSSTVKNIYFEPAAADNGLALDCAFYGWLEYLKMPTVAYDGSTCFGKQYTNEAIDAAFAKTENQKYTPTKYNSNEALIDYCAAQLVQGKTIGWFQSGCEFGSRSLGRRSILAHPGIKNMKDHINRDIKFREDFRPFAPAVL